MADETSILTVEGVSVRQGEKLLLDRVDLAVAARSIHVVVGPNGAGKTTLISTILGRTPFTGKIVFHWQGSGRIGYVPQNFAVDRTLPITVAEFLALERQRWPICFGVRSRTRTRIEALLGRVGLGGLADRRLGVLSGGELRRVLLANAIDPVPELLICDEAASGLDPEAVTLIDALLARLRDDDGVAALLVSHNLDEVRRLADRVTRLQTTVVQTGASATVLAAGREL